MRHLPIQCKYQPGTINSSAHYVHWLLLYVRETEERFV